jgi:hypothetical protein
MGIPVYHERSEGDVVFSISTMTGESKECVVVLLEPLKQIEEETWANRLMTGCQGQSPRVKQRDLNNAN